jgi:hypothetical protein
MIYSTRLEMVYSQWHNSKTQHALENLFLCVVNTEVLKYAQNLPMKSRKSSKVGSQVAKLKRALS